MLTPEQRHRCMAAIHGKDTKPEVMVRKYLWACGFRYRLNHPRLPGKPDIVLLRYRTCIFINGCFWHGHNVTKSRAKRGQRTENDEKSAIYLESSECCKIPKTNREFWMKKIQRNKERDLKVQRELALMGWHSITLWECELRPAKREQTLQSLVYTLSRIWMYDNTKQYSLTEDELSIAAEE